MTITADALTAWMLTYDEGPVNFLRQEWRDGNMIPDDVRQKRLERLEPLLDEKRALKPPTRAIMIESAECSYDDWRSNFIGKDKDWATTKYEEYQAKLAAIPGNNFLYVGFDIQDNQVIAHLFIDNMSVMLNNNVLSIRERVPEVIAESLIGQPISRVCDHEVFKNQAITITGFVAHPMQRFTVKREISVTID